MPGEQLVCIVQAVKALDGSKATSTSIPRNVLNAVLQSLQTKNILSYTNQDFSDTFPNQEEITYKKMKAFIISMIQENDTKMVFDCIESACWAYSKDSYSSNLSDEWNDKLWRISNRLIDENSYPPRVAPGECTWLTTKITAMLGIQSMTPELVFPDTGLSFQDLVDTLCTTYFNDLQAQQVESCIDDLYRWLVCEIIKTGWLYRRTKNQANWTNWSKRWCVLTATQMSFMDKPQLTKKSKAATNLDIKRQTKVENLSEYRGIIHKYRDRFKVSNYPIIECELATDSELEKKSWMTSLTQVINASKENMTPVQKLLKCRRGSDVTTTKNAEKELDKIFKKTILRRKPPSPSNEKNDSSSDSNNADVIKGPKSKPEESSTQFLEQEKEKLKAVFLKIDKDGNGVLTRAEFTPFVKSLGLQMKENEVDLVFKTCDKDGNGKITYEEFEEYFAKHILGENGTGKCVAALRRAFLKADRDGSGTLTFKEFTEYMWERKRSVRISMLFDTFGKMTQSEKEEVSFHDFQEFLQKEEEALQIIDEAAEDDDGSAFEKQLKNAFDQTESQELAQYVRERWNAFATFRRKGARGKTVMKGGHGMVADFVPGDYSLIDLACFNDLPPLVPKHTVVKDIVWKPSTEKGKSGKVIFPNDFSGQIVTDLATNELLRYYDCSFADSKQEKISLLYRHGIQDFTYENEYLSDYVKATNGGAGIERHEFSHLDCPLDEDSGHFILAKITEDNELHVTAFRVPVRHTLYIPGGSIHSNDYLRGTWRTMLSDEADIDHVHLTKETKTGDLEHFCFTFV